MESLSSRLALLKKIYDDKKTTKMYHEFHNNCPQKKEKNKCSPTGNRTQISRVLFRVIHMFTTAPVVTGGYTDRYTMEELDG